MNAIQSAATQIVSARQANFTARFRGYIRRVVGIPHIRGSEELLGDEGVMKMLGFTQEQMENGLCNRGDANQYGKDLKKNHLHHGLVYNS